MALCVAPCTAPGGSVRQEWPAERMEGGSGWLVRKKDHVHDRRGTLGMSGAPPHKLRRRIPYTILVVAGCRRPPRPFVGVVVSCELVCCDACSSSAVTTVTSRVAGGGAYARLGLRCCAVLCGGHPQRSGQNILHSRTAATLTGTYFIPGIVSSMLVKTTVISRIPIHPGLCVLKGRTGSRYFG